MKPPQTPVSPLVRSPLFRAWTIAAAAVAILATRKPWALQTPQLWAEDGTIHLNDVEQWDARAFLVPYRGYLHALPRLIAWIARHTADVAHWPAIYNWAALLVTALLFARIMSPRLALPGKPWLVLAFVLVAHSGEIFFNITNLHWLTGFFLLLQFLIARPVTFAQRAGDFLLIVLAGLSDPIALIFLPLFIWRWARERNADNLVVLLLVGACAGIQAWFLHAAGLHADPPPPPVDPGALLERIGARLIVWPFFGSWAVSVLPAVAQGAIGAIVIAAIALWTARPHPRRALRLSVLAAWVLFTCACIVRIRPDTWPVPLDNLGYAEPYCYLSRVLLAWLVIWEFDAQPRFVGILARAACVAGALLALPVYRVPAHPDYHWAEHCEPIRRGVPANIPTQPEGWTLEYHGRPTGH